MRKAEFLAELQEALQGEVSAAVIQENLDYYNQYISQEAAAGRSEEEIIGEIGGPRLIARTIIDSSEAAGDMPEAETSSGSYGSGYGGQKADSPKFHYMNLNKWYWKLLLFAVVVLVMLTIFTVLGGIFAILIRFAGPLIVIWFIYTIFKNMQK